MKRGKSILIFSILLNLYSCGAGFSDLMLDMGNNYHYYGEGTPSNYIYKQKELSIDKIVIRPNVERFAYNNFYILIEQKPSLKVCSILLGSELNSIARAFKYIDSLGFEETPKHLQESYLANIGDSIFYKKIGLKITPRNTIEEQKYFESLADSIIKIDLEYQKIFANEFNYWIIVKETDEVFGPYLKQEYLEKKKALGVPHNLKLSFEKNENLINSG